MKKNFQIPKDAVQVNIAHCTSEKYEETMILKQCQQNTPFQLLQD